MRRQERNEDKRKKRRKNKRGKRRMEYFVRKMIERRRDRKERSVG